MFILILNSYASHISLIVRKKIECNELITWDLRPMLRTTKMEVKFIAPKTTLIVYLFSI